MPPTVHKVLLHGADIISQALLPIGQLSEEAQEARNKDFKNYRESFSRKMSRTKTNEDVLHLLLITSDPFISSLRKKSKKKFSTFDKDALSLLIPPATPISFPEETEDASNDSDDSTDSI